MELVVFVPLVCVRLFVAIVVFGTQHLAGGRGDSGLTRSLRLHKKIDKRYRLDPPYQHQEHVHGQSKRKSAGAQLGLVSQASHGAACSAIRRGMGQGLQTACRHRDNHASPCINCFQVKNAFAKVAFAKATEPSFGSNALLTQPTAWRSRVKLGDDAAAPLSMTDQG